MIPVDRARSRLIPISSMCSYEKAGQPGYRDLGFSDRDLGNRAGPPSHMNTSNFVQKK